MPSIKPSLHALERMGERMITMDQVYECILYGINIETQYHGRDIKAFFQEPTGGTPGHYVIVADSTPFPRYTDLKNGDLPIITPMAKIFHPHGAASCSHR